ncbi:RNase A-like domain-containing protein [Pseudomonas sp. rhizo25]|uniref:RNase A-like domain-containing protein n=1 Tax=Pseudomonas sp. rhizo25 TaxID=3059675 RepID=UPI00288D13E7|nr:RNase A-like domain-containing protein [Pseudomonas sp. rhizo25]MDT3231733.1 hypothetical protein [Pseudomonas sp. rhizo25]
MPDDGEFRIALSFAQMAAILTQESLSPAEIMSNRIVGSLRLVGGVVELAGAGVLYAVPEPTLLSKAGCIAMGIHASDQLSAGATQLLTGKETDSFAFKAGSSATQALGASRATGQVIGLAAEFAVPLSTASLYNAFRVSSVRGGRITVITSEKPLQAPKKFGGGHTISKHVDKDMEYLKSRFASRKVHVSSTFYNLDVAEWAVSQALQRNKLKILMYSKARFVLKHGQYSFVTQLETAVGWGVTRQDQSKIVTMSKLKVTIKYAEYNRMPYYIITAFSAL